jgi:hypothetical protein
LLLPTLFLFSYDFVVSVVPVTFDVVTCFPVISFIVTVVFVIVAVLALILALIDFGFVFHFNFDSVFVSVVNYLMIEYLYLLMIQFIMTAMKRYLTTMMRRRTMLLLLNPKMPIRFEMQIVKRIHNFRLFVYDHDYLHSHND